LSAVKINIRQLEQIKVTQAQDEFHSAATLGLSRIEKNVLDLVVKGIKEDIDASSGTPAGSNTQIQFNNNGVFGADSDLTYNTVSNTLTTSTVAATNRVSTEQVEPPNGQSLDLALFGGSTSTDAATAGTAYLIGGEFANPNAGVTGTGGDVFIRGGDGPGLNSVVNGGNVTIQGGDPQNGGTFGSVDIRDIGQLLIETTDATTAPRFRIFPTTASSSVTLNINCVDDSSLATLLITGNGGINHWSIDSNGDIWPKQGQTSMEDGFLYISAAAGAPTGTPSARTGTAAMYFDNNADELYVHNGTAWIRFTPAA
jgi:hypothetical protein